MAAAPKRIELNPRSSASRMPAEGLLRPAWRPYKWRRQKVHEG
jgi:hypothetical protein